MKLVSSIVFLCFFIGLSAMFALRISNEDIPSTIPDSGSSFAPIKFHYVDDFNVREKEKMEEWLTITSQATQRVLGIYPFDLHFYMHRADASGEPVPWANTQRSNEQGVNFHVDTSYPLEDFLQDWTAPHEISHLAIPFVGKSNSWFAEGFATYMQNEILLEMGQCTQLDIDTKFKSKLDNARPYYQVEEPYASTAMALRQRHRYPEMYWGGAVFFIQLDALLDKEKSISLCQLLTKYQACCRLDDENLQNLLTSWDSISSSKLASDLMYDYTTLPAKDIFPN